MVFSDRFHVTLQDRIRWEDTGERKVILTFIVMLNNFRSRAVGINSLA
jgi:hypothetical protein